MSAIRKFLFTHTARRDKSAKAKLADAFLPTEYSEGILKASESEMQLYSCKFPGIRSCGAYFVWLSGFCVKVFVFLGFSVDFAAETEKTLRKEKQERFFL